MIWRRTKRQRADYDGYEVDNHDSAPARLATDLPVSELYTVLAGLHRYREAALRSLAATVVESEVAVQAKDAPEPAASPNKPFRLTL